MYEDDHYGQILSVFNNVHILHKAIKDRKDYAFVFWQQFYPVILPDCPLYMNHNYGACRLFDLWALQGIVLKPGVLKF
jgi:hypothetical protein